MMAGLQFCGQRGSLVWDVLKNPVFYNQKAENIVKKKSAIITRNSKEKSRFDFN